MNTSILQLDDQAAERLYGSAFVNVQTGITGSILILCGLQLMIFGFRCFRTTLAIAGFLMLGTLTWVGLVNSKPADGYSRSDITMFVVPLSVGLVGALFGFYFWKLSVCLVGLLGGLTLALYICCWKEDLVIPSVNGRIGFLIGLPLLMLLLMLIMEKQVILFSVSFSGAFSLILGIDLLAYTGYIQNHWQILVTHPPSPISPTFTVTRLMYIMQAATLFVFILSYLWQLIFHLHEPYFGGCQRRKPPIAEADVEQEVTSVHTPALPPLSSANTSVSSTSTQMIHDEPSFMQLPRSVVNPSPSASESPPITNTSSEIPTSSSLSSSDEDRYPLPSIRTI